MHEVDKYRFYKMNEKNEVVSLEVTFFMNGSRLLIDYTVQTPAGALCFTEIRKKMNPSLTRNWQKMAKRRRQVWSPGFHSPSRVADAYDSWRRTTQ